ncbi:Shedu anti-phage system protein SduA domain-containing protein [Halobaculum roseum]|uniref:Shedu anti-phage system protein SduA domain-containing protein n=1 Tax=Halobaculum roseum TaxID=2175149 RepID=A0ABD5MIQ7_9EURY|nr:Shedu anti-phage system protein SduA domain-containing protein [Halobaculum roseum]QZY04238.1 DUF4263 domain-containing protein [Halobaculum roseum]
MNLDYTFEGESYELEIPLEDKSRLTHIAQFPLKNGPETFKFVHIFGIKASSTGKKIVVFWKAEKSGYRLEAVEETQFECQPDEVEKLISLLDEIEELTDLDRGTHVILKKDSPSTEAIIGAIESITTADSEVGREFVIELIRSVSEISAEFDDVWEFDDEIPDEVVDLEYLITRVRAQRALEEFRGLIQRNEEEKEYQDFLENNPWIFGGRYVDNREERHLTRDEEVDFCLETVDGYFDIFEIKRPGHTVMIEDRSHDNFAPSSKVSKAVTQVQSYIAEIEASRDEILRRDKMDILKPRGTVVIGSDISEDEREGLRLYNSFLNQVDVVTYSEVARKGERLIEHYEVTT